MFSGGRRLGNKKALTEGAPALLERLAVSANGSGVAPAAVRTFSRALGTKYWAYQTREEKKKPRNARLLSSVFDVRVHREEQLAQHGHGCQQDKNFNWVHAGLRLNNWYEL